MCYRVRRGRPLFALVSVAGALLSCIAFEAVTPTPARAGDVCETYPQPPGCPNHSPTIWKAYQLALSASEGIRDDDGDVPTAPFLPAEAIIDGQAPPGELTGPLMAYSEQVADRPLTAEAAVFDGAGDVANASQQPVSSGSCNLHNPKVYRAYHLERARRGDPPYFYGSTVGAKCSSAVQSASCFTELWRRQTFIDNETRTDVPRRAQCSASTYSGYYSRPRKHYSKNIVQMVAPPGNFWGSGRGPSGWDCSGQRTRTLSCRRDTRPES